MDSYSTSSLDLQSQLAIDRYCVDFEKALRRGDAVTIEAVLSKVASGLRRALFAELLLLELNHSQSGQPAAPKASYQQRFPDYSDIIDSLYPDRPESSIASTAPPGPADSLEGRLVGGYRVLRSLARGGMGVVYEAEDPDLSRTVILKMLAGDTLDEQQLRRFRAESRALAALDHPNVLKVYAWGDWFEQPYLVLEYARGGSLADRLQNGPLDEAESLALMESLLAAVSYVHSQNMVHRDLKPSNILFSQEGVLKLCDFGLVKDLAMDAQLTRSEERLGTPAYMAPEQLNVAMGEVSPATDIYALGAILHQMLTGETPFGHFGASQLAAAVAGTTAVSADELRAANVSSACIRICLRCLQKRPSQRYRSVDDLLDDIRRARAGQGVSPLPLLRNWLGNKLSKGLPLTLALATGAVLAWRLLLPVTASDTETETGFLSSEVITRLPQQLLDQLNTPGVTDSRLLTLIGPGSELQLSAPQGLALHADRYLAIADSLNHRVLLLDLQNGQLSRVAGSGYSGYAGDGAAASQAALRLPAGIHFDPDGQLYIADRGNHALRLVNESGDIETVSGILGCSGEDAADSRPFLCYPQDVLSDSAGGYFIADSGNARLRHQAVNATLRSLNLGQQEVGAISPFPRALAGMDGNLYALDFAAGKLLEVAGNGELKAIASDFIDPVALATDGQGALYVGDRSRQGLYRINVESQYIEVLRQELLMTAGRQVPLAVDGLAIDSSGRLFFVSRDNNSLNVILPGDQGFVALDPESQPLRRPGGDNQFLAERLQQEQRFSYVEVPRHVLLSDLSARLGLELRIHPLVDTVSNISMSDYPLSGRNMLAVSCFFMELSCAIEDATLVVANPDDFAEFTAQQAMRLPAIESFIGNADKLPSALTRALHRTIDFASLDFSTFGGFLEVVEENIGLRFTLLDSASGFAGANFRVLGRHRLGEVFVPMVLANGITLSFDEQSHALEVGYQPKAEP
jgi:serine/threonine protein kinase/sugar lactone lactonase YvrE